MGRVAVFVMDSTTGRPAEALGVRLERRASGGGWETVAAGATRGSGEVPEIVAGSDGMAPGEYRLVYATGAYFRARGVTHFHGEVTVTFTDRIVRNSDRKDIAYHFAVINKKEANAFALPGGYVYTYTELMKAAGDEAEFAAVVAHEIGHVAARHSTERLTQQHGYQFVASLVLGQDPNATAKLIADLAATGGFLKYSRDAEFEADRLGAKYLYAAGYDPRAMIDFLEKIRALETSEPSTVGTWLMTHPSTSDRLARVRAQIAGFPPLTNPARNAAAYAAIKAQLPN